MISRIIFAAVILPMIMVSCSNSSDSDQKKQGQGDSQYKESYQLVANRCDTEKHDFISQSAADVKKQLCDALQNDRLNRGCAEQLRREMFEIKCSGFVWTPVYDEPTPVITPIDPKLPNENLVRENLRYALVDSYQVESSLDAALKKLTVQVSEDMALCGLSYMGPKCLNYDSRPDGYSGKLYEENNGHLFVSNLSLKDWPADVIFAFNIRNSDQLFSEELTVYLKKKDKNGQQSITEYLADPAAAQILSKIRIQTQNITEIATEKLQNPENLKQLYHLSHLLKADESDSGKTNPKLNKFLVDRFEKNQNFFSESTETNYQYAAFEFLEDLRATKPILIAIADALLKVDKEEIQQFAAVQILFLGQLRIELKPIVLNALDHKRASVRIKAIKGLALMTLNTDEQNKIILKMNDVDYYVRNAAYSAADSFTIQESQLPILKSFLAESKFTEIRKYTATLVGKMAGQAATTLLISSMSDEDYYVREEINNQLKKKNLSDTDIPELKLQMQSTFTATRRFVVNLLGKINSESANNELIISMSDDDYYVREAIAEILKSKTLNENNLSGLKAQLASTYTATRMAVAGLLGKIGSDSALIALIKAMSDDDYYVREGVFNELINQQLQPSHLQYLSQQLKSQFTAVRMNAAKLIAKISGDASVTLLIKHVSDDDYYVREQILNILDSKAMDKNFVDPLSNEFSSSYTEVRKNIAKLLGKIKSKESLDALNARLKVESDYYVKEEINNAIKAIGNNFQ